MEVGVVGGTPIEADDGQWWGLDLARLREESEEREGDHGGLCHG